MKKHRTKTWFCAVGGGLVLGVAVTAPLFVSGFIGAGAGIWVVGYCVGAILSTMLAGVENPEERPDRFKLGILSLLGGIASAAIMSAPLLITGFLSWGCGIWVFGCVVGTIYTLIITDPVMFEDL
jgi:hypothetical protein